MVSKEENILLNAEKLFSEKGFTATSTREISKEANVNISMISYYFGSKEKLYEKLFEYRMNESLTFFNDVNAKTNLNEWEKLELVIDRYAERIKTGKTFFRIMQREQITNQNPHIKQIILDFKMSFLEFYHQLLESGFKNKVFTKKPRLEILHSSITGTLYTAQNSLPMYKKFFKGDDNYETEYFDETKTYLKNILKHLLGYEERK